MLGQWAATILSETLPAVVHGALYAEASSSPLHLRRHLNSVEDQSTARSMLGDLGLVAFVGDGAVRPRRSNPISNANPLTLTLTLTLPLTLTLDPDQVLPRRSGASDLPMSGAVPFASPPELKVSLQLPHLGEVSGMGIKRGVSLIAGGGFHGMSTLL